MFDCGDHDISNSAEEEENFREIIHSVFVNGGVFHRKSHASASGDADKAAEFITDRVRQQTHTRCVFRCGDKHTVAWGPIGEEDLKKLALSTRVAAKTLLERVRLG